MFSVWGEAIWQFGNYNYDIEQWAFLWVIITYIELLKIKKCLMFKIQILWFLNKRFFAKTLKYFTQGDIFAGTLFCLITPDNARQTFLS